MFTRKRPLQLDPLYGRGSSHLEARRPLVVEPPAERRVDGQELLAILGRRMSELGEKSDSIVDIESRFEMWSRYSESGLWAITIPPTGEITDDTPCYWSPRCGQLARYTRDGDFPPVWGSWFSRIHPDDKATTHQAFLAHINDLTGSTPFNTEYRLRLSTGPYRWFRSIGGSKRDESGKAICSGGSLSCIDHEKALAENATPLDEAQASDVRALHASLAELTDTVRGYASALTTQPRVLITANAIEDDEVATVAP